MVTRRPRFPLLLPALMAVAFLGMATPTSAADLTGHGSTERPPSPLVEKGLEAPAFAAAFDASFEDVSAMPDRAPRDSRLAGQRTGDYQRLATGGSVTIDARAIRSAIDAYRAALGDPDALLAEAMHGERWHLADVHMQDPAAVDVGPDDAGVIRVSVPQLQFERRMHRSTASAMLYVDFRLRHVLPEDLVADDGMSHGDIVAALDEMEALSTLEIRSGVSLATTD